LPKRYSVVGGAKAKVIDLPKGTYKVVVPPQAGFAAITSSPMVLRS
jgi:hypothetical protein